MSARPDSNNARRRRLRRLLVGGLTTAALVVPMHGTSGGAASAVGPGVASAASAPAPASNEMTMVQANIYTGLNTERFQQDVSTVLSQRPDVVTYNEVPFRSDAVMAPAGYSIWRDMRNRFTAATPVAWRTDRWKAIDRGVFRISNWRGRPPGRSVELGRRFANWVTLQGTDGRVVSVVSAHVAPLVNKMPDLVRGSVARLGTLTDRLSPAGPVLVGGDFNVHYTSGRYPRDLLAPHGLVPTYDTLGTSFATGDHQGATIDYIFNRGAKALVATEHHPVELRSDHDAVVATLAWSGGASSDTVMVRSDPTGTKASRLSVLRAVKDGINAAPAGASIRVATSALDVYAVRSRLAAAARRGVSVKVSVVSQRLTEPAAKLRERFRAAGGNGSWVRRCRNVCAKDWRAAYSSPTLMLISSSAGTWKTRYDISRPMTLDVVRLSTQATRTVDRGAVDQAAGLVAEHL